MLEEIVSNLPKYAADAITVAYRAPGTDGARFVYVNDACIKLFGYTADEMLGENVQMVNDPATWDDFIGRVAPKFAAGQSSFVEESTCIRKDGTTFWASMSFISIPEKAAGGRYSAVIFRDITDLKSREMAAEAALAEREDLIADLKDTQARLLSAIDTFPDPFAIFDRSERLLLWNSAYADSTTDNPEELYVGIPGADVFDITVRNGRFPQNLDDSSEWLRQRKEDWRAKSLNKVIEMSDDRHYRLHKSLAPNGDVVVLRVNITELVRKERELQKYALDLEAANREISKKALLDELTGLGNRRWLAAEFDRLRKLRKAFGGEIAALHVDLDRFKQINDTMGHAAGDHVLCEVAKRIRATVRRNDVVARIGGDEFVVLMHVFGQESADETLAERLVSELAVPVCFEGKECRFGASVGVARTPMAAEESLLTNSDIALYKAKHAGRSQVGRFDLSDLDDMRRTKTLADDLMRGLENEEFFPVYQPQIDAQSGEAVALETLARWQHPERGLLLPGDFVGAAEDFGILPDIDSMIFEAAIQECSQHFADFDNPPSVSFNVSGNRIRDTGTARLVAKAGEYPGRVTFELLETIFLEEESDQFFLLIDALRDNGIGLELDDFGSGRASLVALERVAPDRLKIDRRLVEPVTASQRARQLVASIVGIGAAMEIAVTAEGVETAEHARILTELGCTRLQGFHFARPTSLASLAPLFSSQKAPTVQTAPMRRTSG